ncbi:MAG: peptidase M14 [Candidatus Aminicenantes bacterium]|nr:peptidase M14 [Candidatus Aminicenantes bacterium]
MNAKMTITLAVVLILSAAGPAPSGASAGEDVRLSFDHYYDHAELTRALRGLEKAYPDLATVRSIGKSVQGRDLWAILLNNPRTGPAERKPGYYIDGNIHGNEIQGGEVALYIAWYLLKNYGKTDLATRLLDERAFYIVPTMNPDSREFYIHQPSDPNSPRTGWMPFDDDRDGALDEDGFEDLDGDGSITRMRKKDPYGGFKPHPDDPRLLIPVKPGETGVYALLGEEGIDNDGDGLINEDGPGEYDMNRNFGYNWQPHYVQRGSGPYPFCFPETKAVADFLMAHPNILGAQTFHNYGGMILRGPGAKNLGEMNPVDRHVLDAVGKKGESMLPGYRYIAIYKDMYTVYGGSIDFFTNTLGIFSFSNELDMDLAREPRAKPRSAGDEAEDEESGGRVPFGGGGDLEEMAYQDLVLLGEHYTDWKPYTHPLYGEIEIGGKKKFASRVTPLFKLAETCHRNAAFVLYHADQLPRLSFARVRTVKVKDGLFQVDVLVANATVTPTISAVALQKRLHRLDRVSVEGGGRLLAAGVLTDPYRNRTLPLRVHENAVWIDGGISGHGRVELRLMIAGRGAAAVVYDSLKGGYYRKDLKLE